MVNETDDIKDTNDDDSNIEHINNLIANPDDLVVEQPDAAFKDAAEEEPKEEMSDPVVPKHVVKRVKNVEHKPVKHKEKPVKRIEQKSVKREHKPLKRENKAVHKVPVKLATRKINMKKKNESPKLLWLWIVVAVLFVVAVAFLLYKNTNIIPVQNKTSSEVAAIVNGEPIYMNDINTQYGALSPVMQQTYSKEYLLNQTIDELLLVQYADKLNIKIDPQAVSDQVNIFKVQNSLSEQQFQDVLKQQNMTLDQLRLLIEKRLKVRELLNETILSNVTVTYSDELKYYNDNVVKFKMPAQVTVQHILVAVTANFSSDQAKQKIDNISGMLNDTNFCNLVSQYSDDTGSKSTCGTYTFGAGEMDPSFENASFSLAINDTAIIKSVYGWHLIKKLASIPAGITPFESVASQINQTLYDEYAQANFDSLMATLRQQAVIVNYLVRPAEQAAVNTTTQTAANITNTNVVTSVVVAKNLDSFAQCLTNKSIVFYGANSSTQSQDQAAMFGDSIKYLNYIECSVPDNPQLEAPECEKAQISGYPTWQINGQNYAGEQTLDYLAKLSGCTLPQ